LAQKCRVPSKGTIRTLPYTVKDTGEVITLTHTFQYQPERVPAEDLNEVDEEEVFAEEEF
jgi:hypothetical protein